MEEFKGKPVVFSLQYVIDSDDIFNYSLETFGKMQALKYEALIDRITSELYLTYWMYPECRHLSTEGHIYRNIILESHLIIYRINTERVEVIRIIHSKSSISHIRTVHKIKF